jgi:hypothetical protein
MHAYSSLISREFGFCCYAYILAKISAHWLNHTNQNRKRRNQQNYRLCGEALHVNRAMLHCAHQGQACPRSTGPLVIFLPLPPISCTVGT